MGLVAFASVFAKEAKTIKKDVGCFALEEIKVKKQRSVLLPWPIAPIFFSKVALLQGNPRRLRFEPDLFIVAGGFTGQ